MSTEATMNGNHGAGGSEHQQNGSTFAAAKTSVLTPVSTSGVMPQADKSEKFKGSEFKRWQQKMLFYLTTLGVANFLTEDAPVVSEEETDFHVRNAYDAWHQGYFLCKNYVLNCLEDSLYSIFAGTKTSKELWEALDKKYRVEDAGTKKYVVVKFLDYKMVDSRSVVVHAEELQIIIHDVHAEGMVLPDQFIVAAMIEKLPSGWTDFKNYLKHKREEMKPEDLIVRLRVEEDNRRYHQKPGSSEDSKANLIERGRSSKRPRPNEKR
ncbi:uncharacterized protein LOC121749312 [Salvia splendens]|uniref:uncharacterized protein LOC121749312 n=1 Tax=Salvia splendens TaxID=180675 RepID=UPI001C268BD3|nr:uncharacterized protein LOC121749312 [Salvia splendens]